MKVSEISARGRVICPGRGYRQPKVSIVTPTYRRNAEGLLAKCLDSAMAQTFDDLELLVIDDGSFDGSEFTIRDAAFRDDRIVYIRHDSNSGIPAVRTNEGVMRARGEAIAFLFDDNIFRPDFIASAWEALERSGADVVHTNVHMLGKEGRDFTLGGWPLTLELLRNLNTIPNGGVMVRRSFFERFGMYDPHILMRRICDWDLWLRALALGATFHHLEQVSSVEHGLVSENSLGNTIAWDVKVAYAYMLDDARFAERSRRLTPAEIGSYDVLDPEAARPYVRSKGEWAELVETVYAPFLGRHGTNGFDPSYPSNRAASLDPREGWNPEWSALGGRRRFLVVSNSMNSWASAWVGALRQLPGAIVVNCPEWQLAAFRAADVDLLVLLDCTAAFLDPQLAAFRAARVPVLYVIGYGTQDKTVVPADLANRHFERNPHIAGILGSDFYFPQAGIGFGPDRRERASAVAADAYAIVAAGPDAERLRLSDVVRFPSDFVVAPHLSASSSSSIISYGSDISNAANVSEIIALPGAGYVERDGARVRASWEGLGALAECRPGSQIIVSAAVMEAAPLAERVGLSIISRRHRVTLTSPANVEEAADAHGAATPEVWLDWIGNIARGALLSREIARARGVSPARARVGIFLNSEMFSGSEVYGLMLARALHRVGYRVQVFIPERTVYGADSNDGPLNQWLIHNGLEAAVPAPYRPGSSYLSADPAMQTAMVRRLSGFVRDQELDIAICSGFMPEFAALSNSLLLFMALFQPSAYRAGDLAFLRGRVSGILSDSEWSLAAHRRLLGGPGAVVRAMIPIDAGPTSRPKSPQTAGPVSIAIGGTLQPRKRQLQAIEAVRILRDRGMSVALNIYGYSLSMMQDYVRDINEAIAGHNLHGLVRCHGLVKMHEIARDNDVVLMASADESLPQTLVDMMRLGLIGVAGLSGGIDEVIEDKRTGYLTTDLSPRGLADVLARAIGDRPRWPEVAANARALIDRDHSIARNTAVLLDLLIEGARIERSPFGRLARECGTAVTAQAV